MTIHTLEEFILLSNFNKKDNNDANDLVTLLNSHSNLKKFHFRVRILYYHKLKMLVTAIPYLQLLEFRLQFKTAIHFSEEGLAILKELFIKARNLQKTILNLEERAILGDKMRSLLEGINSIPSLNYLKLSLSFTKIKRRKKFI